MTAPFQLGWRADLEDREGLKIFSMPRSHLPDSFQAPDEFDPRPWLNIENQGQMGCHREGTEVLTDSGWKEFPNCRKTDLLATVAPITNRLEFQRAIEHQEYEFDGGIVVSDHEHLSFGVTPNHRMLVRPWHQARRRLSHYFQFVEAADIGWYSGLLAAPQHQFGLEAKVLKIGKRKYTGDELVALVAVVLSDGWVGGSESTKNKVGFCCFREDRDPMVRELADRLGFSEYSKRRGVWVKSDPALAQWFRENAYHDEQFTSPFKHIPSFVKALNVSQIGRFLDFYGDQYIQDGQRSFYTSSIRMADDLQELLLRSGCRAGLTVRPPRQPQMPDGRTIRGRHQEYRVGEWRKDSLSLDRKRQLGLEQYRGQVFCATVPNSTLVTRYNGQVLISGNSCAGHACSTVLEICNWIDTKGDEIQLSRMFAYIVGQRESGISGDSGATISGVVAAAKRKGICLEETWPYPSHYTTEIPDDAFREAGQHKLINHSVLGSYSDCWRFLASGVGAIEIGVPWKSSLANNRSGVIEDASGQTYGGHAVAIVGWTTRTDQQGRNYLILANSHGEGWGAGGFAEVAPHLFDEWGRDDFSELIGASDLQEYGVRDLSFADHLIW